MTKPFDVNFKLSLAEYNKLTQLFQLLAYKEEYHTIPYDLYMQFEKIMVNINSSYETSIQSQLISDRLENMKEWATERCKECGHEAHDHAFAGTGLCCSEGCPCFKFVKKQNVIA